MHMQEKFKQMKYETATTLANCERIGRDENIKFRLPEMKPTLFCIPQPLLPRLQSVFRYIYVCVLCSLQIK